MANNEGISLGLAMGLINEAVSPSAIEGAVSDWLDDHPEATTTVADGAVSYAKLDTTLKGKADAVATLSDEIIDVKSAFESTLAQTWNLLNDTKRYRTGDNVYFGTDNGSNLFETYLEAGAYTFTVWYDNESIKSLGLYIANSSGSIASGYTRNELNFTVTTPGYYSARVYATTADLGHLLHAQIESGSTSTNYVIPFAPADIEARTEIAKKLNNNINVTELLTRAGYRDINGDFVSSSGYRTSNFIGVNGGKIHAIHNVYKSGSLVIPWCVFLTNNGVVYYVNDTANTIPESNVNLTNVISEIDVPGNAYAVAFCCLATSQYEFNIVYDSADNIVPVVQENIPYNDNQPFLIERGIPLSETGTYKMTNYVQVKSGDIIEMFETYYIATNYHNYRSAFAVLYDKDFCPVTVIKIDSSITSGNGNAYKWHKVAQNEKYVRFSSAGGTPWASISRIGKPETDNTTSEAVVFPIPSSMLTEEYYFNYNGIQKNGLLSTKFIPINAGDVVFCRSGAITDITNDNIQCIIAFFDKNKCFISGVYNTGADTTMLDTRTVAPEGTRFIVVTKNTNATLTAYYCMIAHSLSSIVGEELEPQAKQNISLAYPNAKKSISIIGDSISQGEGVTNNVDDSYAGILRKMFKVQFGGKLNYGFCSFSTLANDMVKFAEQSGFSRNYGDSTVLGGDSYTATTAGSTLEFKIKEAFPYLKIASVFGGTGVFTVGQGNTIFASIDLSTKSGIGYSDAFSIANANFSENFVITLISGTVKVSGVQLITDTNWTSFNNYGRSGADPNIFVGDLFEKESESDIVIYALGANGGHAGLKETLDSIKDSFGDNVARKFVLDVVNNTSGNFAKHYTLRNFANETGAEYIGIMQDLLTIVPSVPNDFFADGVHPAVNGHRFIAETFAKVAGLTITSKDMTEMLLSN